MEPLGRPRGGDPGGLGLSLEPLGLPRPFFFGASGSALPLVLEAALTTGLGGFSVSGLGLFLEPFGLPRGLGCLGAVAESGSGPACDLGRPRLRTGSALLISSGSAISRVFNASFVSKTALASAFKLSDRSCCMNLQGPNALLF